MRKREVVVVPAGDGYKRDVGKHFLIVEWDAARAENWAWRAVIAYNRGGGQIPTDVIGQGMQAIFWAGVNTFLRGQMVADEVIPILDQLLECVTIIRDPKRNNPGTGEPIATPLLTDDIEEVKTRLWLRSEVLRVHTNFSVAALVSSLLSAIMTASPTPKPRMFRRRSPSSSHSTAPQ